LVGKPECQRAITLEERFEGGIVAITGTLYKRNI
jgi:hypothetical protein